MAVKIFVNLIITTLAVFGGLFIIYINIVGIDNISSSIVNYEFQELNEADKDELRLIGLDITQDCGDSSFCYAQQIYWNISQIDYVPASQYDTGIYSPIYVYEHMSGDCKASANLFVSLLNSLGVYAYMDCAISENHCISVVQEHQYGEVGDEKLIVDLTIPMVKKLKLEDDNWDYQDVGVEMDWNSRHLSNREILELIMDEGENETEKELQTTSNQ